MLLHDRKYYDDNNDNLDPVMNLGLACTFTHATRTQGDDDDELVHYN